MRLTAAITREGDWYVEVEVTSQGESLEEARANLVEALESLLRGRHRADIAESPVIVPLDMAV